MFEPSPLPDIRSADPMLHRTPPARRWVGALGIGLAALLALSGVLGSGMVISGLLTGSPFDAARTGYAYVPDSTTMVYEFRLDLPAGQREQLARLLTRFPGFEDEARIEGRLTEMLDEAIRSGSNGQVSWAADIEPWFGGWMITAASLNTGAPMGGMVGSPMLVVAGVTDRTAAEAAMLKLRSTDMEWTSEDADGTVIWSARPDWYDDWPTDLEEMPWAEEPWMEEMADIGGQAYAVTDDALLYATRAADIKEALRTRAGDGVSLLESGRFADALRRAPAGRLGLAWADLDGMGVVSTIDMMLRGGPFGRLAGAACGDPRDAVPRDVLATLHLSDGRGVIDVSVTLPQPIEADRVREGVLAAHVPADTFLYAEVRDVGSAVKSMLACLRDVGDDGGLLKDIEKSTGNLDDLVGWATDTAVALRYDGTRVSGGILAKVDDQARAAEALGALRALVTAGGGQLGNVTVREEEHRGVRIVVFELGGEMQAPAPAPSSTLAYALTGDMVVIGVDASFTRAVLDTDASASLATAERFRGAIEFAGAQRHAGLLYVDVPTAMSVYEDLERLMPGSPRDADDMDEYISAISDVVAVSSGDGSVGTMRVIINTRERP